MPVSTVLLCMRKGTVAHVLVLVQTIANSFSLEGRKALKAKALMQKVQSSLTSHATTQSRPICNCAFVLYCIYSDPTKKGTKKRKADGDEPEDPSAPSKKKTKPMTKVTKGRFKGPVDYDKQCGVINDKNLPCSRSLTCKSHSMGAKRAVQGRSKAYDELLLEWNRANNPNWVEPVKRETKAEKKEKREKEKAEKKRLAMEAAAAAGVDITKKGVAAAWGVGTKKGGKKAAAAAAAAVRLAEGDDDMENYDDIDSEVEVDALVHSVRAAQSKGVIGVPLAIPCDA